jgi:hypothetical protein
LNTDALCVLTLITADARSTEMVPVLGTKMKRAAFGGVGIAVPLNIGLWIAGRAAVRIAHGHDDADGGTLPGTAGQGTAPVPVKRCSPAPLSETHHGLPELRDMPQGLRGSIGTVAMPGILNQVVCL